jgi:peptide/nickel transport system substrate-binding protein
MMHRRAPFKTRAVTRRAMLTTGASALAFSVAAPHTSRAQTPKRGGTLRISNGGDPPDFDLHQSSTYLALFVGAPCYSTLLRIDPNDYNKLVPDLAEKYSISADGINVTFNLRSGVQFHNGMPLTAEDVVYSLDRIRKPPAGLVSPRKGLLGNIASVKADGDLTVVVTLKQPQFDFPFLVSNPYNVIVCKKVAAPLDAQGQGIKRQIVGTGPFKLTQAIDGQIYEVERFDKYFGQIAYLDKLQFFPIKGEIERSLALQGKRIDACFFFSNEPVLATLRKAPDITGLRRPTPTFVNLIPNVKMKPFDDIRVREAISLAIDRDAFIKTVGPLAGALFHSNGLLMPGSPYSLSDDEIKQFAGYDTLPGMGGNLAANRQKAMALLEQAGVPKGFKVVMTARGDIPAFRDSSINVAAQLKTIGLDATVDIRDPGAYYAAENKGDFQLIAHSVGTSGSLPDQILGEGYTSFGGRNYGQWKDEAIDDRFRAQSAELDPEKRKVLIRDFQIAFLKTYYQINLAWVGYGAAHSNSMKGWNAQPDLYANMQLNNVWLES